MIHTRSQKRRRKSVMGFPYTCPAGALGFDLHFSSRRINEKENPRRSGFYLDPVLLKTLQQQATDGLKNGGRWLVA